MIFDSHAHYDDEAFDKDRDRLLSTLEEQGVGCIVNVGASFRGQRTVWSFLCVIRMSMRQSACIRIMSVNWMR